MDPEIWGPKLWFVIHTIALNFPDEPTYNDIRNTEQFFETFNNNLIDIALSNNDVFGVKTEENQNIQLFDGIKYNISELSPDKQDDFARAIINQ